MQEPGLEQSPADKQYSKILRNFSKEQKVNDQRIKGKAQIAKES